MLITLPPLSLTDEILDFLVSARTPEAIIALRLSPAAQVRLRQLLVANREDRLTEFEQTELDPYLQLEHFVRSLKIRARENRARQV